MTFNARLLIKTLKQEEKDCKKEMDLLEKKSIKHNCCIDWETCAEYKDEYARLMTTVDTIGWILDEIQSIKDTGEVL